MAYSKHALDRLFSVPHFSVELYTTSLSGFFFPQTAYPFYCAHLEERKTVCLLERQENSEWKTTFIAKILL